MRVSCGDRKLAPVPDFPDFSTREILVEVPLTGLTFIEGLE